MVDLEALNKELNGLFEILMKKEFPNAPNLPRHPVFQGGKFAILTAESPKYPVHQGYEGENDTLIQHLNKLKEQGHIKGYEPVKGFYDAPENSFLVYNPNFEKIKELGHKFGQESVILSNNMQHQMAYTNGELINQARPHVSGTPVTMHETKPENYYTETLRPTKHIFTIPVDFSTIEDVKGRQLGVSGKPQFKKAMPTNHQLEMSFDTTQFMPIHSDKQVGVIRAFRRRYGSSRLGTIQ